MRPLLRSEHRDAAHGTPAPVAVLAEYVSMRECAGRACLLAMDRSERQHGWHDPLSGRIEPFERALARARRDAAGGLYAPFAGAVDFAEERLAYAAGCAPLHTGRGVRWTERSGGPTRTLLEIVGVVAARVLSAQKSHVPLAEGRAVVREGYDQRPEGQGDDVAQPPAPDDEAGPGWPDDGEGFAAVEGAWPARDALGESLHGDDVAPAGAGALCR